MFRSFSKMDKRYLEPNSLKNIHYLYIEAEHLYGLNKPKVDFILFVYDLEFFTIDYVSEALRRSRQTTARKVIYPLMKDGYIYKHFDKLTPKDDAEGQFFREETKYNYKVRYALSQSGRIIATKLIRKMAGEIPFTCLRDEHTP